MNPIKAYELLITQIILSNADIKAIFGFKSSASVWQAKRDVLLRMAEKGIYLPVGKIHLITAYEVWGLEEKDLERRYAKARKYGMVQEDTP